METSLRFTTYLKGRNEKKWGNFSVPKLSIEASREQPHTSNGGITYRLLLSDPPPKPKLPCESKLQSYFVDDLFVCPLKNF